MADKEELNQVPPRYELYRQIEAIFTAHGIVIDEQVEALLQPLLAGSQDYAQCEGMLQKMIAELES
jgi:hypothetical protein